MSFKTMYSPSLEHSLYGSFVDTLVQQELSVELQRLCGLWVWQEFSNGALHIPCYWNHLSHLGPALILTQGEYETS